MEHGLNLFGAFCESYPRIDKNFARHRNADICTLHVFCLVSKRGCKDVVEEVAKHLTSQHSSTERSCMNYTTPKIIIKPFFEKNCNLCTIKGRSYSRQMFLGPERDCICRKLVLSRIFMFGRNVKKPHPSRSKVRFFSWLC